MEIKSVFENMEIIPKRYTADGENISPPLSIINPPKETKSFVLIVDDPDAPTKTWVHWIVYDIPTNIKIIDENKVPTGAKLGMNDFKQLKYGGPSPPTGAHKYFFKLYAISENLNLKEGLKKEELETLIRDKILASSQLIGIYQRR